ncbi:hypothetical protein SAMN05444722_1516 [Rhodovulum sp. ES.010]|uniref:hypothetical protein n=1 Tax=Rhodovulum sp. ES.010 TaxID=1882821 RepID=UPI00092C84AA|nr:hypothetical protein [Rhodovulum sp. ES.010]SIO33744.1 hypothetical protein SAMN05444722_1516 [Rhodovulum sp. ES.010]
MADRIDIEVMDKILASSNWKLATGVGAKVLTPDLLFPVPQSPPRPALVVPVDLQALYVPRNHRETYVRLPLELGEDADPVPPFTTPRARAEGVHLHWAIPDALLRGEMVDDAAPLDLPALPDRWLVVRMTGRKGARQLDQRAWVIEAEKGCVYDLADYPGGDATAQGIDLPADRLDGMVGGSPNWSASYDAALNRFAFHDDLDDVDPQALTNPVASYVVVGWWSRRGNDPLSGVYSAHGAGTRIAGYDWVATPAPVISHGPLATSPATGIVERAERASGGARRVDLQTEFKLGASQAALATGFAEYAFDDVVIAPLRELYETVMEGYAFGVPVAGRVAWDLAPRERQIGVSLAPTLERLVAAQASRGMNVTGRARREYFESLITAVANSSIMQLDSRDGVVGLDEAEHADGFETFKGPERIEEVIVERKASDLRAGRPLRTKQAEAESGKPPRADVIWTGAGRGTAHKASVDELRETIQEVVLREKGRVLPAGPQIRTVVRPGPRYHRATPPVIGLRDYGKPNRFLGDGRFDEDGRLICRWSNEIANTLGERLNAFDYVPEISHAQVPRAADLLVRNAMFYDSYLLPWCYDAIGMTLPEAEAGPAQNRLRGEVALRVSADGVYDGMASVVPGGESVSSVARAEISDELRRFSLLDGRDPSPVAITNWAQPWAPVWLEWEVALEPGDDLAGWTLGRIDFEGASDVRGGALTLRGRSPITSGLARTYQSVIDTYLKEEAARDEAEGGEIGDSHQDTLADLSDFLKRADLGSVTLDRIDDLWLALDTGPDGQILPVPETVAEALRKLGLPRLIASGRLRLTRARVVDTFGRYRDPPLDRIALPAALEAKDADGNRALAMPPRLSLPARLMWRFVDPADTSARPREARLDQATPVNTVNPVAGYLLPDFIDESVEFFDRDGTPLGEVLHDPVTGGLVWEGGVGRDGPAATSPTDGLPAHARLAGLVAKGMIDADIAQRNVPETAELESPLSAFLRAVDTTMWGVDSSLASSGATIAGLVGRPVALVETRLWLDIPEDLAKTGAFGGEAEAIRDHLVREGVYDAVKSRAFQVRLGEFAKGHDGLYGFFLGGDFTRLHLIEKEVVQAVRVNAPGLGYRALLGAIAGQLGSDFLPAPSPLDCPYITGADPLSVHSGQRVRLTLLMHPAARVHATTGFLPRKGLELLQDWVAPGLGRIAPSARVGPVLIDPDKVRLPKIAAFGANQSWTRRGSPVTWRDDPILSATQAAILPSGRVRVEEGYIRIAPGKGDDGGEGG